ncbi:MAG TPA: glycosyltransferase family 39 protein [Solirubrobacteraceae bacterium]|nr:glycosyltransferase family 39 protein [Solirubrobacteraceae bacterium]
MSASVLAPAAARRGRLARLGPVLSPTGWAVLGLTILAAVIRFFYIGHQGFWFDEGNTALLVRRSAGGMLGLIPQTESTPPLYYMVAWVWVRIFGDTEAGLRSLSALAGVLTVPVAYGAASRLLSGWRWGSAGRSPGDAADGLGRRAGLIAASLTACSPFLIWYSQEGRSYEMLVLLSGLGLLAFAQARANPTPRALAGWVIACALSLLTHYYAAMLVVPEAVWLLWEHRRLRRVQVAVGLALACGAALIPLALSQNSTGRDSWIGHSPFGLRLAQVIPQFLIGTGAPARTLLKFIALALALVSVGLLLRPGARDGRRGAVLAGGLALSGFVITLGLVAVGSDFLITRNIIVLWLPAAIAVSGALAVAPRWLGGSLAAGLCTIGLIAAIGVDANYNLQRPNWRPVAAALGAGPAPGQDRLLLIQHYRTLLPLSLYVPHLSFLRGAGVAAHKVSQVDVISIRSPQQPLCWWGAACNLIPSQMQARFTIPGFHVAWRRQVEQFTIVRLVSDHPVTVSARQVGAALQTTELRHDGLLVQRS